MKYSYKLLKDTVKNCSVFLDEDGTLDVIPTSEDEDEYYGFMYYRTNLETEDKELMSWSSHELYSLGGSNELEAMDEVFVINVNYDVRDMTEENLKKLLDSIFNDDEDDYE